ncbi:MAG: FHA domain-containing protein [Deltaproteobacteria bacterium]|nr:FHA domain-containing protein [Deltaproteobacteria bacterium]
MASPSGAGIQVFVSRLEAFLGAELFTAEKPLIIGRHSEALLRLDADTVSRRHCRIQVRDGALWVEDLGSANGTLVNRKRIQGPMRIKPADAVQVGPYTLKLRLMMPAGHRNRADSRASDQITRVEAIFSVEGSQGTTDARLSLPALAAAAASELIDRRLYDDAVFRATGMERPRTPGEASAAARREGSGSAPPRPLSLADTESELALSEVEEREATSRHELYDNGEDSLREPTSRFKLDEKAEARMNELERAVSLLESAPDTSVQVAPPRQHSDLREEDLKWVDDISELELGDPAELGPGSFTRRLQDDLLRPAGERAMSSAFEVVPLERMAEFGSTAGTETERGALFEPSGPTEPEQRARKVASIKRVGSSKRTRPERSVAHDGAGSTREAGVLSRPATRFPEVSAPPVQEPVGSAELALRAKTNAGRSRIPARLVTPTGVRPQAPMADPVTAPTTRRSESEMRSHLIAEPEIEPAEETTGATQEVSFLENYFDAVEITARTGDELLDIAVLRKEGEQYVLGHKTPQGAVAPYRAHPGLRLLRINDERQVDLVFPHDVAGTLVRDGETVALVELTEGRKYSSLRLRAMDVATVILGAAPSQVSYTIRFTRAPRFEGRRRSTAPPPKT